MADLNYLVTLQAASDSIMTINNVAGATALEDYDCRKMYGLPHMFVASGYMKSRNGERIGQALGEDRDGNVIYGGRPLFVINDSRAMHTGVLESSTVSNTLRWDEIDASSIEQWSKSENSRPRTVAHYQITAGYGLGDSSVTGLQAYTHSTNSYLIDRRPTTTAFQLRCESVQHSIQDMSSITALPGIDYGTSGRTGTPEQLDNLAIAFGMRKETITLNGIMIDRGRISASNPRRQVILNIARSQYLKIRNLSPIPDANEKEDDNKPDPPKPRETSTQWGGQYAGPMNPRSYPCLTILGQGYDASDAGSAASSGVGAKGDVEADGGYRIYRGIIRSLSWTMEEGRPDFWRWKMTFEVIQNEKRAMNALQDATNDVVGKDGEDVGE